MGEVGVGGVVGEIIGEGVSIWCNVPPLLTFDPWREKEGGVNEAPISTP